MIYQKTIFSVYGILNERFFIFLHSEGNKSLFSVVT